MRAVLKMGALKLSFGGNQYIISQRIRSLVEIERQFRCEIRLVEISLKAALRSISIRRNFFAFALTKSKNYIAHNLQLTK